MRHPPFPALLASLSVAACTVGPSYVESSPAVAPGWISATWRRGIDSATSLRHRDQWRTPKASRCLTPPGSYARAHGIL